MMELSQNPPSPALPAAIKRTRELEAFIRWEDELFSNPHLSGNHKLEIRATRRAVERAQTHDEQGRARINLTTIAEQIGVSPDTMSRGLKVLKQCGIIADHDLKPEMQENGERWTRHYVALNEELLSKPKEIQPPAPRNHGGNRYHCQKCGSDNVKIRTTRTIVCKCCNHETELDTAERDQEPDTSDDQAQAKNFDVQGGNLQGIIKPVSPLCGAGCAEDSLSEPEEAQTDQADLEAAAALLLALAGQTDEHIEMSRTGRSKYYTVKRPLSLKDTVEHLQGGQARGTTCSRPDGRTRGLCWDADDAESWERLKRAARQLADVGYLAIFEESPADRGGHLWVIYDALVSAAAARHHAHGIAPDLATLVEYWPPALDQAQRWNKVRLPGGKYIRRGPSVDSPVNAWCRLVSVADGEISERGQADAARFLLSHQTPAGIVPTSPAISDQDETAPACDVAQLEPAPLYLVAPLADTLLNTQDDQVEQESKMQPSAAVDSEWYAKYNTPEGRRLWFSFTPAHVAAWWNQQHNIDELLPSEKNGYGIASWRGEHTASVAKDGEGWADFGASARQSDGSPDTGDALELQQRLSGAPKPELMRQAARELIQEARQSLESAARASQPIPAWLEEIITDAGREHYARVAAGYQDQAAQIRAARNEMSENRNENTLRIDDQAQASTETDQAAQPQPPAIQAQEITQGGLTGFSPPSRVDQESQLQPGNNERQRRESEGAVTASNPMQAIAMLDAIKDYGQVHEWPALVIDGKEIIPAGRSNWLHFVWLSQQKDEQHRVHEYIKGRSQFS